MMEQGFMRDAVYWGILLVLIVGGGATSWVVRNLYPQTHELDLRQNGRDLSLVEMQIRKGDRIDPAGNSVHWLYAGNSYLNPLDEKTDDEADLAWWLEARRSGYITFLAGSRWGKEDAQVRVDVVPRESRRKLWRRLLKAQQDYLQGKEESDEAFIDAANDYLNHPETALERELSPPLWASAVSAEGAPYRVVWLEGRVAPLAYWVQWTDRSASHTLLVEINWGEREVMRYLHTAPGRFALLTDGTAWDMFDGRYRGAWLRIWSWQGMRWEHPRRHLMGSRSDLGVSNVETSWGSVYEFKDAFWHRGGEQPVVCRLDAPSTCYQVENWLAEPWLEVHSE